MALQRRRVARGLATFAAMVIALAPIAVSSVDAPHAAKPRVTHVKFANGLDVAVVENHAAPLAQVAVWYGIGSADDPPGRAGLAHALEHMLYRGTHVLSGAAEDELDARLGIEANARTDYETTSFHQLVPVERVELAMRIEAARMRGALLRERDWKVERGVVMAEMRSRRSPRSRMLRDAVRQMVFRGTPYAHDPGGTLGDVSRITVADMRAAYHRAYTPHNATLVVTGDVVPGRVVALARAIFGPMPGGAAMPASPDERPVRRGGTVRLNTPGSETLVDIALESPDMTGSAEAIASEVLDPAHDALSLPLVTLGPCSSYNLVEDTQANAGLYHVICHLEPGADPREPVALFGAIVRTLADKHRRPVFDVARRAVAAKVDTIPDDLEGEANYFGSSIAGGSNPNHARYAASDAEIAAMLRRWSTPIAVGIMSPSGTVTVSGAAVPAPATNGDAPHGDDAPAAPLPAWARSAMSQSVALHDERRSPSWFALPNGVRLAVQRRTGSKHVYVRAGFDDAHLFGRIGNGVGRVAGSIFVAGSRRWPELRITDAADAHAMSIDLDAESNANGFATDLPLMLDILADAWRAPRIDARYVRSARRAAIREADRFAHNPDSLAVTILTHRLDDPDARDPAPAADQRHADTSERAVRAFFRMHVRPERAWLAVVGDVDPATVYRQVTRALAGWHVAPADSRPSAEPAAAALRVRPAVRRVRVPRAVTRVLLGTTAPKRRDPDHDGMTLLDTVLAGAMETRSMRAIRFRRGLAYSVSSSYDDEAGRFFVGFQCAPSDRAAATALLRSALDDLAVHPPSADELDRARGKLIGDALRAQGSADGMLDALTTAARDRRGDEGLRELGARYRAVGSSDLARIARAYLDSRRFVEVDVGP